MNLPNKKSLAIYQRRHGRFQYEMKFPEEYKQFFARYAGEYLRIEHHQSEILGYYLAKQVQDSLQELTKKWEPERIYKLFTQQNSDQDLQKRVTMLQELSLLLCDVAEAPVPANTGNLVRQTLGGIGTELVSLVYLNKQGELKPHSLNMTFFPMHFIGAEILLSSELIRAVRALNLDTAGILKQINEGEMQSLKKTEAVIRVLTRTFQTYDGPVMFNGGEIVGGDFLFLARDVLSSLSPMLKGDKDFTKKIENFNKFLEPMIEAYTPTSTAITKKTTPRTKKKLAMAWKRGVKALEEVAQPPYTNTNTDTEGKRCEIVTDDAPDLKLAIKTKIKPVPVPVPVQKHLVSPPAHSDLPSWMFS